MRDLKTGIDGALLMGGYGKRMGGCRKELLLANNRSFYEIAVDALSDCDRLFLSVNRQLSPLNAPSDGFAVAPGQVPAQVPVPAPTPAQTVSVVADVFPDRGPLSGMYSVMKQSDAEHGFVLACDMPLMKRPLIRMLCGAKASAIHAVVPVAGGKIHPLCALYRTDVRDLILRRLEQEQSSVKGLLDQLSVKYIDIRELGFDPVLLTNVNVPEIYQRVSGLM